MDLSKVSVGVADDVPLTYARARVATGNVPPFLHELEDATNVRLVFGRYPAFPDFLKLTLTYRKGGRQHEFVWSGPKKWTLWLSKETLGDAT